MTDSIIEIGKSAFDGCDSLSKVFLNDTQKKYGSYCIYGVNVPIRFF